MRALAAFRNAGVTCDAVLTERAGHASSIAGELGHLYEAVFTLGGDGTVLEVVGALAHTGIPVGVLPGGTGNLIARVLGIPMGIERAVRALVAGTPRRIDLGRTTDGRYFAFAAGVGIDASMVLETTSSRKRRLGVAAYVISATIASLRLERFSVVTTVDGVTRRFDSALVMVANFGSVLNDLIRLGPGIVEDDGRLDLCVFSPRHLGDALRIAWRIMRKDFRPDPCLYFAQGTQIRIETLPPRLMQADGELLGMTPIQIAADPRAATLLVPSRA